MSARLAGALVSLVVLAGCGRPSRTPRLPAVAPSPIVTQAERPVTTTAAFRPDGLALSLTSMAGDAARLPAARDGEVVYRTAWAPAPVVDGCPPDARPLVRVGVMIRPLARRVVAVTPTVDSYGPLCPAQAAAAAADAIRYVPDALRALHLSDHAAFTDREVDAARARVAPPARTRP